VAEVRDFLQLQGMPKIVDSEPTHNGEVCRFNQLN